MSSSWPIHQWGLKAGSVGRQHWGQDPPSCTGQTRLQPLHAPKDPTINPPACLPRRPYAGNSRTIRRAGNFANSGGTTTYIGNRARRCFSDHSLSIGVPDYLWSMADQQAKQPGQATKPSNQPNLLLIALMPRERLFTKVQTANLELGLGSHGAFSKTTYRYCCYYNGAWEPTKLVAKWPLPCLLWSDHWPLRQLVTNTVRRRNHTNFCQSLLQKMGSHS